jgi:hypothetical protein
VKCDEHSVRNFSSVSGTQRHDEGVGQCQDDENNGDFNLFPPAGFSYGRFIAILPQVIRVAINQSFGRAVFWLAPTHSDL